MIKAILTIIAGIALLAVPEPIVSSAAGAALIAKGIRMLRSKYSNGEDEPPDSYLSILQICTLQTSPNFL